jgi:GNAT superfamily N-acetyltransferase/ribosomal protein S27AE
VNIRPATADDVGAIESTAQRSFRASYALSPQQLETLLDERFSAEALGDRLDGDASVFVVDPVDATGGDVDLAGFTELDADGTMRWLHVHPESRGRGVATTLLERVEDEVGGSRLRAQLLEQASEGSSFLQRFDLEWAASESIEVGGERFDVQMYERDGVEKAPNEPAIDVPREVTVDDEPGVVQRDEELSGTDAPFYPVYESDAYDQAVGFLCSSCGATSVVADQLDRLECTECQNTHRADEWDPAYL